MGASMNDPSPLMLSHPFPATCNGGKERLEMILEAGCTCGGEAGTLTKRKLSNGVWIVALQCDNCGSAKSTGLKRIHFQSFESFPLFDEDLSERYLEKLRQSLPPIEIKRQTDDVEWQRRYDEFLNSREWTTIRNLVIARDECICQACGQVNRPNNLRAHHLSYGYGFAPPLWLLVTVCADCHDRLHADKHGFSDPWCPHPLPIHH